MTKEHRLVKNPVRKKEVSSARRKVKIRYNRSMHKGERTLWLKEMLPKLSLVVARVIISRLFVQENYDDPMALFPIVNSLLRKQSKSFTPT